jgi:hypothetical protein
MRAKIVDQGAGDGCLTNATFIGANENNGWSGHGATLTGEVTDPSAQYLTLSVQEIDRSNSARL